MILLYFLFRCVCADYSKICLNTFFLSSRLFSVECVLWVIVGDEVPWTDHIMCWIGANR